MKNKTILVFTLILLALGITKVQAVEIEKEINPKEERLETIIEINKGETWQDLEIAKYNQDEMQIYKIGTQQRSAKPISVNRKYDSEIIFKIVENGYAKRTPEEIGVSDANDAYIATKIAIDCIFNKIKVTEIDNIENLYRAKEGLSKTQEKRANDIIQAVKNLLAMGYDESITYDKSKSILKIGDLEKDTSNPKYLSQRYTISTTQPYYKGFKVLKKTQTEMPYYIANVITREEQETFERTENQFRVMIPKEYDEDTFELDFDVETIYDIDTTFIGTDGNSQYIILANIEERYDLATNLIHNPKGNMRITTIVGQATYELYDENNNMYGPYTTDEGGKVLIENLKIGKYRIKQTAVKEGYKLSVETEFSVEHGKTLEVIVYNQYEHLEETTIPKEEEPTQPKEEKPEESVPTKTDEPKETNTPKEEETEQLTQPNKEELEQTTLPKEDDAKQSILTNKEELEQTTIPRENIQKENVKSNTITRTTLPRTGNDYFIIKLISTNIVIFILIMCLIKKVQDKKQTVKSNSLNIQK